MLKRFLNDESGQGMVEYALIIALIAVVVIVAVTTLGGKVSDIFDTISDSL
jgi:pilus assembly protein Flp/PilA